VTDRSGHGNESSGIIKGGQFLYQFNAYQLLKEGSDPWIRLVLQFGLVGWPCQVLSR
jgi:hypothetical protein